MSATIKPANGYPTLSEYFEIVDVSDLHCAMRKLIRFVHKEVPGNDVAEIEDLWHSANILSTFAKTLEANAEAIELGALAY